MMPCPIVTEYYLIIKEKKVAHSDLNSDYSSYYGLAIARFLGKLLYLAVGLGSLTT